MDDVLDEIARRLRIARAGAGVTQAQAAALSGVSQYAITCYERGLHDPRATAIRRLALAYGVSADWLLGLSDRMGPD